MGHVKAFFKNNKLGFLSGALLGSSWIPLPPWALMFCLVPVWTEMYRQRQDLRRLFTLGWATQFTLSLIGFHWIAYTAHEFGFMPWPIAFVILVLFASVMHIYFAISAWVLGKINQKYPLSPLGYLISLAFLQSLVEFLWPSIFPWNMGYPLFWAKWPLYQSADIIGFQGLSYLVYLINALLAYCWLTRSRKAILKCALGILAVLAAMTFYGFKRQSYWANTDSVLKTLVVQGNIGNLEKLAAEQGRGYEDKIAQEYFGLTRDGLSQHPDADFIVWPESAYPEYLDVHQSTRALNQKLVQFLAEIKKPLFTGAYSVDPIGSQKRKSYNAIFLFDPSNPGPPELYHKTHLLIFGETLPLVDTFPWLAKYNPGGAGFGRGSGAIALPFQKLKIGPQICYESLYPEFSNLSVKKGANLLVNVTNDSWFGPDFEPFQHMQMTLARAIETRRPMIRSTNTGISTVALADGSILEKSLLFQKSFHFYEVKYRSDAGLTIFTQYGNLIFLFVSVIHLALMFVLRERNARN